MLRINLCFLSIFFLTIGWCQTTSKPGSITTVKEVDHTPVKDQGMAGVCWSFSTISLIESESIGNGLGKFDLSEIFIVRNIYKEKARNYILRQGKAQFGEGGLGHDVIHALATYGAVPESVYSGMPLGQKMHDHRQMDGALNAYLDSLLATRPIPANWMDGFDRILNSHLGTVPTTFAYGEKQYTPKAFAEEVLHFRASDYINITSFSHHPFYSSFILEVPDNFSNTSYYNVPLNELIGLTKRAVEKGHSVMWDADVSNELFRQKEGLALQVADENTTALQADDAEIKYDQSIRQNLFENLTTQDDHLMHVVGSAQSPKGKYFFVVKNSWGEVGPYKGYINVSEAYFAINTISLVVPKAALDESLLKKLGIGR